MRERTCSCGWRLTPLLGGGGNLTLPFFGTAPMGFIAANTLIAAPDIVLPDNAQLQVRR